MVWGLEWGGKVEFLKKLQEQGQTVPALDARPRLKPWLAEEHRAFQTLSASRSVGMSVGPIPLSEMKAYLDIFGITDIEERESFITMMQALDSVYLKHAQSKREESKAKTPAIKSGRRRK